MPTLHAYIYVFSHVTLRRVYHVLSFCCVLSSPEFFTLRCKSTWWQGRDTGKQVTMSESGQFREERLRTQGIKQDLSAQA